MTTLALTHGAPGLLGRVAGFIEAVRDAHARRVVGSETLPQLAHLSDHSLCYLGLNRSALARVGHQATAR